MRLSQVAIESLSVIEQVPSENPRVTTHSYNAGNMEETSRSLEHFDQKKLCEYLYWKHTIVLIPIQPKSNTASVLSGQYFLNIGP